MYFTESDINEFKLQIAGIKTDLARIIKNPDAYSSITTTLRSMSMKLAEGESMPHCIECGMDIQIYCEYCGCK